MDTRFILNELGSIQPYGDTNVDEERFENIEKYGELCEALIDKLIQTASYVSRHEYSMRHMAIEAERWLEEIKEMIE